MKKDVQYQIFLFYFSRFDARDENLVGCFCFFFIAHSKFDVGRSLFIPSFKTWSFGPGQRHLALPMVVVT